MQLNRRTTKHPESLSRMHDTESGGAEPSPEQGGDAEAGKLHDNPFGPQNSYLNGAVLDTLKVVITLSTRNTLMELVEFFHQTILDADPGNARPPKDLIDGKLSILDTLGRSGKKGKKATLASIMAVTDRTSLPQRGTAADGRNSDNAGGRMSPDMDCVGHSTLRSMGGLFMVQATNVQVQLLDQTTGSTVIFAVGDTTVQGWIGALLPRDSKETARCEILQRLIRRELPTFVEAINVQVQAASIYAAPSDLSSGQCQWIQSVRADSAVKSSGIFRCLLSPISLIEVNLIVEHSAIPVHSFRVEVPEVNI
jgi:hypothetical protein